MIFICTGQRYDGLYADCGWMGERPEHTRCCPVCLALVTEAPIEPTPEDDAEQAELFAWQAGIDAEVDRYIWRKDGRDDRHRQGRAAGGD